MSEDEQSKSGTVVFVAVVLILLVGLLMYYQYGHLPMIPSSTPPNSASRTLRTLQIGVTQGATTKTDHAYAPSPAKLVFGFNNSIVFYNNDSLSGGVLHTATDKGGAFGTGALKYGQTSQIIVLPSPGVYTYYCQIHPKMNGRIVVVQR